MDPEDRRSAVGRTYDRIGEHFAETRRHPWPEVEAFVDSACRGEVALDVGCANGRHVPLLAECCDRVVGVDLSRRLLSVAADRRDSTDLGLARADAAALPVADGAVDLAVYVATLHHLPTREGRIGSLDELARVLRADGRGLVSAWSTEHDRFDRAEGFDTTVDWTLPGGETVPRFYHVYDPDEFRTDLGASDLRVRSVRVSSGNCYAAVEPGE